MNWKTMPLSHKIATVISCLAAVAWLIFEIKPNLLPVDPTCPAIAVLTICEAVVYWKEKRKWAYLLIGAAVVSTVFFVIDLMI